jgi:cytochrome c peroxidase
MNRTIWRWVYLVALVILATLVAIGWQYSRSRLPLTITPPAPPPALPVNEPIQPIPEAIALDPNKVNLGQRLFRDPLLSADQRISCLSCHHLSQGGADQNVFSVGVHNTVGTINAPTVYNAGFNAALNWDGQFATLEDFTEAVIPNPMVMGQEWPMLVQKLRKVPTYQQSFAQLYPDGITATNIINALAIYQRSLITPNSRFDQYLRGNQQVLKAEEKEGYRLFKSYGCVSCHQGMNVGGNLYQKFGTLGDYFSKRGRAITPADLGRYNVTQNPTDRFVFRVPSLRNVALSAPYFHDGSAATLEEAITIMANFQLGRSLSSQETELIADFLQTLTGEHPELDKLSEG